MALDAVKNFAKVTVSAGYDDNDVVIDLISGDGEKLPDPANGEYNVIWFDNVTYEDPADDPNVEIVRVTAKTSNELTIVRAQEGTTATAKNTASSTYKMILGITAKMITDISGEIGLEADNETPTGLINGSNKIFTLENTPNPAASLKLFLNGMYMSPESEDYTLVDDTITFINSPYTGGILRAFYKY